jgi:Dienelactone hydrolase family
MNAVQCRDCVGGAIHTGRPTGSEDLFHGLKTYVTRPDEGTPEKGIIIFITDIFGWKFPNSRLLADKYAKRGGYTVYVPDFMRGQSTLWNLSLHVFTLNHQAMELPRKLLSACASQQLMKLPRRFSTPSS